MRRFPLHLLSPFYLLYDSNKLQAPTKHEKEEDRSSLLLRLLLDCCVWVRARSVWGAWRGAEKSRGERRILRAARNDGANTQINAGIGVIGKETSFRRAGPNKIHAIPAAPTSSTKTTAPASQLLIGFQIFVCGWLLPGVFILLCEREASSFRGHHDGRAIGS